MKNLMRIIALTVIMALLVTILPLSSFAQVVEDTVGGDLGYYELGDVTGDGVIDNDDVTFVQEFDVGFAALTPEQITAGDVNFDGVTDAGDAILLLRYIDGQIDSFTTAPEINNEEDMANFFNKLTADAENTSYDWSREAFYTRSVDFGSTTSVLNAIIQGVDANASLDSVIGGFLGLGSKSGVAVNGETTDYPNYALKAMSLTEDDIKSYTVNGNKYAVVLNDCTNPTRNGNTALNHATNDFITFEEVNDSIVDAVGSSMSVKTEDSVAKYKNIILVAIVENNELVNLEILYDLDFTIKLNISSFMTTQGTGATKTRLTYSNFGNGQSNNLLNSFDMQFDYFKTSFQNVKTDASAATLTRINSYNYLNYVDAGSMTSVMKSMLASTLGEEFPNAVYTGDEIDANFPPTGAICNLQKEDIEWFEFYESDGYYIVNFALCDETDPVAGEGFGAVINTVNSDDIADSVSNIPLINSEDISVCYEYGYCSAVIDKTTGELIEYYTDSGMILHLGDYKIGLGIEEDWVIEY